LDALDAVQLSVQLDATAGSLNPLWLHSIRIASRAAIVAAKYRDDLVLRVARAYETLNPIKTPPDPA